METVKYCALTVTVYSVLLIGLLAAFVCAFTLEPIYLSLMVASLVLSVLVAPCSYQ